MAKGLFGGTPSKTTTTTTMSPEQRQLFDLAFPFMTQFAQNPPQTPGFSGVAGFNPTQTQAQQAALTAAAGSQQGLAEAGAAGNQFLLGSALFPETNPALQQTINAAIRPVNEQLLQNDLPSIRGEAQTTGNFGSSRQGIAEGLALDRAAQTRGDIASKVATQGYDAGLGAMVRGLGLLPQTIQAQLAPASTMSAVGDVQQSQQQAILNEMLQRYYQEQYEPLSVGQSLLGLVQGIPGGTTTATGTAPQSNPLLSGLGSIGSLFAMFGGL